MSLSPMSLHKNNFLSVLSDALVPWYLVDHWAPSSSHTPELGGKTGQGLGRWLCTLLPAPSWSRHSQLSQASWKSPHLRPRLAQGHSQSENGTHTEERIVFALHVLVSLPRMLPPPFMEIWSPNYWLGMNIYHQGGLQRASGRVAGGAGQGEEV